MNAKLAIIFFVVYSITNVVKCTTVGNVHNLRTIATTSLKYFGNSHFSLNVTNSKVVEFDFLVNNRFLDGFDPKLHALVKDSVVIVHNSQTCSSFESLYVLLANAPAKALIISDPNDEAGLSYFVHDGTRGRFTQFYKMPMLQAIEHDQTELSDAIASGEVVILEPTSNPWKTMFFSAPWIIIFRIILPLILLAVVSMSIQCLRKSSGVGWKFHLSQISVPRAVLLIEGFTAVILMIPFCAGPLFSGDTLSKSTGMFFLPMLMGVSMFTSLLLAMLVHSLHGRENLVDNVGLDKPLFDYNWGFLCFTFASTILIDMLLSGNLAVRRPYYMHRVHTASVYTSIMSVEHSMIAVYFLWAYSSTINGKYRNTLVPASDNFEPIANCNAVLHVVNIPQDEHSLDHRAGVHDKRHRLFVTWLAASGLFMFLQTAGLALYALHGLSLGKTAHGTGISIGMFYFARVCISLTQIQSVRAILKQESQSQVQPMRTNVILTSTDEDIQMNTTHLSCSEYKDDETESSGESPASCCIASSFRMVKMSGVESLMVKGAFTNFEVALLEFANSSEMRVKVDGNEATLITTFMHWALYEDPGKEGDTGTNWLHRLMRSPRKDCQYMIENAVIEDQHYQIKLHVVREGEVWVCIQNTSLSVSTRRALNGVNRFVENELILLQEDPKLMSLVWHAPVNSEENRQYSELSSEIHPHDHTSLREPAHDTHLALGRTWHLAQASRDGGVGCFDQSVSATDRQDHLCSIQVSSTQTPLPATRTTGASSFGVRRQRITESVSSASSQWNQSDLFLSRRERVDRQIDQLASEYHDKSAGVIQRAIRRYLFRQIQESMERVFEERGMIQGHLLVQLVLPYIESSGVLFRSSRALRSCNENSNRVPFSRNWTIGPAADEYYKRYVTRAPLSERSAFSTVHSEGDL